MKIVCDSCSAKYSIADEKVAGKVFKIRCKKCSAVIVVRGDQIDEPAPQEQESTSVYDHAADAVWHVVVSGDQQGPFAPQQLGEMLTDGTIDWEAYVWREGFEGWLAARDVPELVEAITGQGPQEQVAAQEPAGGLGADPFGAAAASPFGGGADDAAGYGQDQAAAYGQDQAAAYGQDQAAAYGQDQAAAYGQDQAAGYDAAEGGGLFAGGGDAGFGAAGVASHAHADAGADLFGQSSGSPFEGGGGDEDVVASADPRISADQAMTGQRNENSVLFSLANLQALATGSGGGATPSPSPSVSPSSSRAGHASGEGSGLIDIRALAGASGAADSGPSMGSGGGKANVDDLLSIGTGSPLGSSLGAPVLAPVQEERSNKGMLIGLVAAAGILAAAAIVVVIILVTKEPEPVAQASGAPGVGDVAGSPSTQGTPGSTDPTPPAGGSETATPGGDPEGEGAAGEGEGEGEGEGGSDDRGGQTSGRRRTPRTGGMASGGTTSAPTQMTAPDPLATTGMSRGGSIDDLLDMALNPGSGSMMASAPAAPAAGSGLPDQPPRDAVARALRSVSGAVSACGQGQHGVATTAVTVSGSTGRVTNAQVSGQFAGTPVGSCVARAVRGARFPRFGRPSMTVNFPYRI